VKSGVDGVAQRENEQSSSDLHLFASGKRVTVFLLGLSAFAEAVPLQVLLLLFV
jgi:hypothetical protein